MLNYSQLSWWGKLRQNFNDMVGIFFCYCCPGPNRNPPYLM